MMSAYEDMYRFNNSFTEIYGKNPVASLDGTSQETAQQRSQRALNNAQNWWQTVGSNISNKTLLTLQNRK